MQSKPLPDRSEAKRQQAGSLDQCLRVSILDNQSGAA